jgi:hypothetical protein
MPANARWSCAVPRPTHIPVCRLSHIVAAVQPTCWRRAQAGDYGQITRDHRGRQQVELIAVETAEGIQFSEAQIAKALGTSSTNVVREREKQARVRNLSPGPIRIDTGPFHFFTATDAKAFALGCVQSRDRQWLAYLNALRLRF